jgi:hypothetical protein
MTGYVRLIETLLDHGVDLKVTYDPSTSFELKLGQGNRLALHSACQSKMTSAVALLLERGATVIINRKDKVCRSTDQRIFLTCALAEWLHSSTFRF